MEKNNERIMVFIDGNNLYHVIKRMFRPHLKLMNFNFSKFLSAIVSGRKIIRTYYYNAPLDWKRNREAYIKQQKFFEKLRGIPNFNLILCRMQRVKSEGKTIYQVKEDDIHLAVDMVKLAYSNAYDTAILVSSDGDFVPAVNAVKDVGKNVENIGFATKFSYHLKQKCDKFHLLRQNDIINCFDDIKISRK